MSQSLPPRASLEQLRKQAKNLLKKWKETDPRRTLSEAQHTVAQEYGFKNWAALKKHLAPNPEVEDLIRAVVRGDLAQADEILKSRPELLNERGSNGTRTPLHFAAIGGREDAVRFLLERGANPNIRCEGDSATPLHFACEKGRFGIIKALIERGCDPIGAGDYHEMEVIGWATVFGKASPEIVEYLLAHGSRHNIFSAIVMGDVEAIKAHAGDINRRMDMAEQRRKPLHLAVMKKQSESLKTLLELGADTEGLDEAMLTPLDQAALNGETGMARMLIAHGAKIRLPAAIALGVDIDPKDDLKPGKRWGTLIVRAASVSSGELVEKLIQAGASVDVWDDAKTSVDSTYGFTPLHAAGFFGNIEAVRVLMKHGANVQVRDSRYQGTAAGWAAYAGHNDVRDVIQEGAIDIFEAIESGLADRIPGILQRDPEALTRKFAAYLNGQAEPAQTLTEGVYRRPEYTPIEFARALNYKEAESCLRNAEQSLQP